MNSYIIAVIVIVAAVAEASYLPAHAPQPAPNYGPAPAPQAYSAPAAPTYGAPAPVGPPCPKSVVVSCAPTVQTVPCKNQPAPAYGLSLGGSPHGAYSEYTPQYIAPAATAAVPEDYATASSQYAPQYVLPQYAPYTPYAQYY